MNGKVLKEPKGFITIPEIIFSIIAFSVLASYSDNLTFEVICKTSDSDFFQDGSFDDFKPNDTTTEHTTTISTTEDAKPTTTELPLPLKSVNITVNVSYPFRLSNDAEDINEVKNCEGKKVPFELNDTSSSKSIFFMFTAVTSFVFTLIMIPVYLLQDDINSKISFFPILGIVLHAIFFIFWFCGSIAWAAGVANLKDDTSAETIIALNNETFSCYGPNECSVYEPSNYSGPVVSVIFGFFCMVLYAANLFFVIKDKSHTST